MAITNKRIDFIQTTAAEFAAEVDKFYEWLYDNENIDTTYGADGMDPQGNTHLKINRDREFPVLIPGEDGGDLLYNIILLTDIHVLYMNGQPFDCGTDYITGIAFHEDNTNVITIDPSTHVVKIPKYQGGELTLPSLTLKDASGRDMVVYGGPEGGRIEGVWNAGRLEGQPASYFATSSQIEDLRGKESDSSEYLTLYGLKKLILEQGGGSGGGGIDVEWHDED